MENLGQHVLAGFDGYAVTDDVRDLILKKKILGFTLFKWNIESAEQLRELNLELQSLATQAGYQLLLAVDQEGGRVARLPSPFSKIPPMRLVGEKCLVEQNSQKAFEVGKILGKEVGLAGFNLDFAPVVDVDSNPKNPIIGDRSFSSDPYDVISFAESLSKGLISENIIPCFKHFPGHGDTIADSHLELPKDSRSFETLWNLDLLPYRHLIPKGLVATIMTAHVLFTECDKEFPATLSEFWITKTLREKLAYDGVIFSDDLLMKAIFDDWDLAEAAKRFFLLGGDAVLICRDPKLSLEVLEKLSKEGSQDPLLVEALRKAKSRLDYLKSTFLPLSTRTLAWDQAQSILSKNQESLKALTA